jgi:hypothetical protein
VHPHLHPQRGHGAGVAVGVVSRAGSRASVGPAHALVLRRAKGLVTRLAHGWVPALDRSEGDLARASAPLARSRERVLAVLANVPRGRPPGERRGPPGPSEAAAPAVPAVAVSPVRPRGTPAATTAAAKAMAQVAGVPRGGARRKRGLASASTAASTEALVSLRLRAARVHARLHLIVAHRAGTTRE